MLAALPLIGAADVVLSDGEVKMSEQARPADFDTDEFRPGPSYEDAAYDADKQLEIYGGKQAVPTPRPLLELGRRIYDSGPLQRSTAPVGAKNPVEPQLTMYGDLRTAVAYNDNGAAELGQIATRLNLDIDLKLTATERVHAFVRPLDGGNRFTRCEFSGDNDEGCELEIDGNIKALFFEGDVGAIASGFSDQYSDFDLPFSFGLMPLLFQNGVWVEDAFTGFAFSIVGKNSRALDISNMDVTFFAGFDKVTTNAMVNAAGVRADHSANVYGLAFFADAMQGYWELGYGYIDAEDDLDALDYHNFTIAFSRRYGGKVSNSVRVIWNTGQDGIAGQARTADGLLLLVETSLVSSSPLTLVPYLNPSSWASTARSRWPVPRVPAGY